MILTSNGIDLEFSIGDHVLLFDTRKSEVVTSGIVAGFHIMRDIGCHNPYLVALPTLVSHLSIGEFIPTPQKSTGNDVFWSKKEIAALEKLYGKDVKYSWEGNGGNIIKLIKRSSLELLMEQLEKEVNESYRS